MRFLRVVATAAMLTLLLAGPASAGIIADISVTKTDTPDPVAPGGIITYTITVQNSDNSAAVNVEMSDDLPPGTTFWSLSTPAVGWSLTAPVVGGTGTVSATIASFPANETAVFTLEVRVDPNFKPGIVTNTATVTSDTSDTNTNNNASTTTTEVAIPAASLADAAMAEPAAASPLVTLGFTALLLAMLSGVALLAVRRVRY